MRELSNPDVLSKWERFVQGSIDLTGIRREIADSWRRCRSNQINPYEKVPLIEKSSIRKQRDQNAYLIEVASPFLNMVHTFVKDTGFIVNLSDGNGNVLELLGEENMLERARQNNLDVGANRSEKVIGTNGIGLAIVEKKPIQIVGAEHYNRDLHSWTCSAAPIRDTKGNVIGVLNVSGDKALVHKHTLGMMASIVEAMERELHVQERLKNEKAYSKELRSLFTFDDIIGSSASMKKALHVAQMVAATDSRVLLEGESGTGKELFAQAIHQASNRHKGPFIGLNCSAIPKELIESELFGYSDGAFTGAKKGGKPGKFELANGGTLFIDEINSMPMEVQVKLLRVLQQNEVTRIGAIESTPLDVRIVTASNESLDTLVENGGFRGDLFYRLAIVVVNIPPLRERIDDIPILFESLLRKISTKLGKRIDKWDANLIPILSHYNWPGNVRELENYIERAVVLSQDHTIANEHFSKKVTDSALVSKIGEYKLLEIAERESIVKALELFEWNISRSSKNLGISRNTLYKKIKFYNIHMEP